MGSQHKWRNWLIAAAATLLVACDGHSSSGMPHDGSAGDVGGGDVLDGGGGADAGGGGDTGGDDAGNASDGAVDGAAPPADCPTTIPTGQPCSTPEARCGGPCVNSWQANFTCLQGTWKVGGVTACGPSAGNPPQCRNAFSSGALTPCCPTGGLQCAGMPDGYPGFGCTPANDSFCSCTCAGSVQQCGC